MGNKAKRTVLVSGASIAGPALAYWLQRFGFEVTLVEKARELRAGGYPIDIRGTALGVIERMGLIEPIRAAHIDTRKLTFVDGEGEVIGEICPEAVSGGVEGRDLELPRGQLAKILFDAVRGDVETMFDNSIAAMRDDGLAVEVSFRNGEQRTFDLVIGADGLHSNTRSLSFGPEKQFERYLGFCFAGFSMPNDLGLSHEGITWNVPGRAATLYAVGESPSLLAVLGCASASAPDEIAGSPEVQRDFFARAFAGHRWHVPRMLDALRASSDMFCDVVSQIHLPTWSKGRVALVGDAAYAPSFLSGQGSSIALVGAYVLAGELGTRRDHREAFIAYECAVREFVRRNQALADQGAPIINPRTPEELARRNQALRDPALLSQRDNALVVTALTLPQYARAS